MDEKYITILNYPGSKKRLLNFIDEKVMSLLPEGGTVLDIFCGTAAVGYSLKKQYRVFSNDAEIYCSTMADALLSTKIEIDSKELYKKIETKYLENLDILKKIYPEYLEERKFIENNSMDLLDLYKSFLNIWQDGYNGRKCASKYNLFTTYYSNSYFGIFQSMQIDSIRYAIDQCPNNVKSILMSCLYFGMKEGVFSKDGHMAQPLNISKNVKRLFKTRNVNIIEKFTNKLNEFYSDDFSDTAFENKHYNLKLGEILNNRKILKDVDLIYADPPYTDMQYSRYFHLLETVTKYDYPELSSYRGKVSAGIYREGRFQSPLSQRGKARDNIEELIKKSSLLNKTLIFSYAYPVDLNSEKSDRYTMSINELKTLFVKYYGDNVEFTFQKFSHSNNRNKHAKAVYEYLLIGKKVKENII